ncbi:MAG: putative cytosol aminopeptidase, partial [Actinomycetota bacterium]
MDISVRSGELLATPTDLAVLLLTDSAAIPKAVAASFDAGDFTGAPNQTLVVYPRAKGVPSRVLLVGLGAKKSVDTERVRQAAGTAIRQARLLRADA